MSDPRNVAHAKKVTQEKKHHGEDPNPGHGAAAQPGKKPAAEKPKSGPAIAGADAVEEPAAPAAVAPGLEASLIVLTKLKELEFHSRAHLERLAELTMTVEDELKQADLVGPLGEVYAAQSALQTKLTALIEAYKSECDRLQGDNA